ncbi:unnamed protein product [Paramecium pentaurelia]|uniref:Uncharacterized protein n=1 Tax=Paramecium pentaurelia TaxID=43138 RepID=A0A8S1T520_9CILI|nr:unnamed protein product [Paramecium pentaurelia]
MEIPRSKPLTLISMQNQQEGWLNQTTSQEIDYFEYGQQNDNDSDEGHKIYNRQLSYLEKQSLLQKTNFSDEFNSNNIEMKLLHRCGGLLARQCNIQIEMQSNQWITKIFKDVYLIVQDREFESKFKSQILNSSIVDSINKRIKSNSILLAHDPTGSILLKLASHTRTIYYLESDKTYIDLIDRGIYKMNVNVQKVLKMDLQNKIDVVVVNLYFIDSKHNLRNIMHEYLQYAHDIIIILQPNIDNSLIYSQAEQAISLSEQSKQTCSIELQNILENNNCIAKILYFGGVTEITLNDELNFVYSCLDSSVKKSYNYKLMFKDLRNQMGMTKLIKLLNDFQIIQGIGQFIEFSTNINGYQDKYRLINNQTQDFEYENKNQKDELIEKQSSSSSTESEPEEDQNQERLDFRSETLNQSSNSIQQPPVLRHANSQPFAI